MTYARISTHDRKSLTLVKGKRWIPGSCVVEGHSKFRQLLAQSRPGFGIIIAIEQDRQSRITVLWTVPHSIIEIVATQSPKQEHQGKLSPVVDASHPFSQITQILLKPITPK